MTEKEMLKISIEELLTASGINLTELDRVKE